MDLLGFVPHPNLRTIGDGSMVKIAGEKTDKNWRNLEMKIKIDFDNATLWEQALDIFEERLNERYIKPAEKIQNSSSVSDAHLPLSTSRWQQPVKTPAVTNENNKGDTQAGTSDKNRVAPSTAAARRSRRVSRSAAPWRTQWLGPMFSTDFP